MNTTWCKECNCYISQCQCDPPKHIYVITFKLEIDLDNSDRVMYQSSVRCISYDQCTAMLMIDHWLKTTTYIWYDPNYVIYLPIGTRDITIMKTEEYAIDIGGLLKICPLSDIFPNEESWQ